MGFGEVMLSILLYLFRDYCETKFSVPGLRAKQIQKSFSLLFAVQMLLLAMPCR